MKKHEAIVMADEFDPSGSIFLPKTTNPDREFSNWEAAIFLRRGGLFTPETSLDEQQRLYDELCRVRQWWLGKDACHLMELGSSTV